MAEKKEYLWRPNDNSVTTNLRYDLEANHWLDSLKHSTPKPTASFGEVFGFLGLLLSFIFNIIHFIVLILIELVKWIIKVWPKKKVEEIPTYENRKKMTSEELEALLKRFREEDIEQITI